MSSSYSSIRKSLQAKRQETRLKAVAKCVDLPPAQALKLLSLGMDHWDRTVRYAAAETAAGLLGPAAGPPIAALLAGRRINISLGIRLLAQCECAEAYPALDELTGYTWKDNAAKAKRTLLQFKKLPLEYFLKHEERVGALYLWLRERSPAEIIKALKTLDLNKRYELIKESPLSDIFVSGKQAHKYNRLLIETILEHCQKACSMDPYCKGQLDQCKAGTINAAVLALPASKQRWILETRPIREYFKNRRMSKVFANVEAVEAVEAKEEEAGQPEASRPFHPKIVEILPVGVKTLWWLARQMENGRGLYQQTKVKKRSGGKRLISAPHPTLKFVQRLIYENILAPQQLNDAAHGFRQGHSTVTNAAGHVGSQIILALDLKDFFPSIGANRVYGIFAGLGFSSDDAAFLTRLCVDKGCLPQGAPTSPALANLACRRLDSRLAGLAASLNANYSRYADDLTFSGDDRIVSALPVIKKIIAGEGFALAGHKLRIMRRGSRQEVTGLTVNDKLTVPRPHRRKIRAMLFAYARGKKIYWDGQKIGKQELVGHLSYLSAVQPELARRWLEKYSLD